MEETTKSSAPMYYRSSMNWVPLSSVRSRRPLRGPRPRLALSAYHDTLVSWGLYSVYSEYMYLYNYEPILACQPMESGRASLFVKAGSSRKEGCDTQLISNGIVLEMDPATRTVEKWVSTYFVLPETCYDPYFKNKDLPPRVSSGASDEEIDADYYVQLSPQQVPSRRFFDSYWPFFDKFIRDFNDRSNRREPIPLCMFISPYRGDRGGGLDLTMDPLRELEELRQFMVISNEASKRLTCFRVDEELPEEAPTGGAVKIDERMIPKRAQQSDFAETFAGSTNMSLGDFCGYAYNLDQLAYFDDATNHIVKGEAQH